MWIHDKQPRHCRIFFYETGGVTPYWTFINKLECKGTGAEYETHETKNVKKKIIRITQSLLAIDLNMW